MTKNRLTLCALVLLLPTLACGAKSKEKGDDDDGTKPMGQAGSDAGSPMMMKPAIACPDASEPIDPTAMIDDFEDGDGYLVNVPDGGWWTAGDGTLGATMVPEQTEISGMLATPERLPEPRCGSLFAMRVTGQGFTDWGAVMGMNFGYGANADGTEGPYPYDASSRTGVDFWAMIGDTSTNQVRYQVSDVNSEPIGGKCVDGGGSNLQCYDSFGTDLTQLSTTWRRYRIPFAGLAQRDFGLPADGVVKDQIYQITFNFLTSSPFDFWVDDLQFY
jgi:hypothetical protein